MQLSYGSVPLPAKQDFWARKTESSLFLPPVAGSVGRNAAKPAL